MADILAIIAPVVFAAVALIGLVALALDAIADIQSATRRETEDPEREWMREVLDEEEGT